MAAIDDKMQALAFTATTQRTPDEVAGIVDDAATVARGGKVVLTRTNEARIDGNLRNFARISFGSFTVTLGQTDDGTTTVRFTVGRYTRTRSTVLAFIPISPWSSPAYKPLSDLSSYVRENL